MLRSFSPNQRKRPKLSRRVRFCRTGALEQRQFLLHHYRSMLSLTRRLRSSLLCLQRTAIHFHSGRSDAGSSTPGRRRPKFAAAKTRKVEDKSEWWAVDGEMHEIGENVPPRERFVIPRDNIPNKRRKQLREQFMRRTRLVLKESEHEPWCKRYMELYQELRENWERLYWDEGYSKKLAHDHANYNSAEDDDQDFSPYRKRQSFVEPMKEQAFGRNRQGDNWDKVSQIRDKFEYDRERRMRDKAFAPMNGTTSFVEGGPAPRNQPLDPRIYFSESDSESD